MNTLRNKVIFENNLESFIYLFIYEKKYSLRSKYTNILINDYLLYLIYRRILMYFWTMIIIMSSSIILFYFYLYKNKIKLLFKFKTNK